MIVYVFKRNDDYKSIALPAELQGHLIFKIFILINLIKQEQNDNYKICNYNSSLYFKI